MSRDEFINSKFINQPGHACTGIHRLLLSQEQQKQNLVIGKQQCLKGMWRSSNRLDCFFATLIAMTL